MQIIFMLFENYIYLRFTADINMVGATVDAGSDCLFAPMSVRSNAVDENFAHFGQIFH